MPDETVIPFVLAGAVTSWDPVTRRLGMGDLTLLVAPTVPELALRGLANQSVTLSGHRTLDGSVWTVTEVQLHRPGF